MTQHFGELYLTGTGTMEASPSHSFVDLVSNPHRQLVFSVEIYAGAVTDHRPVEGASAEIVVPRGNLAITRFAPSRARSNVVEADPGQGNLVLSRFAPTVTTWTPLNLGSDLIGWFDATDSVYNNSVVGPDPQLATDGQGVVSWADKSGHDHHVFRASGDPSKPTFRASNSIMNNRPTVEFTQFVTWMIGAASIGLAEQSMSLFAVFSHAPTELHNDNRIASFRATGDVHDYSSAAGFLIFENFYAESNETLAGFRRADALNNGGHFCHQPHEDDTPYRFGAICNQSNATLATYLNGVEEIISFSFGAGAFGDQDSGGSGVFAIGGQDSQGTEPAQWGGCISEVVWLRRALSSTERATLDAYFRSKWGFA